MSAALGLLELRVHIPAARSLKDKRRVVRSFKDRTRNRFNVSVAEVDDQDNCRVASLALAMVGSDRGYVESALQKILETARQHREMMIVEELIDFL